MSTNPAPHTNNATVTTPMPFGKKNRIKMMGVSFCLFFIGFPLAYIGGTQNIGMYMTLSYIAFGIACILPLFTKK